MLSLPAEAKHCDVITLLVSISESLYCIKDSVCHPLHRSILQEFNE